MASMGGMLYLLSLVLYIKGRCSTGWPRIFYMGGMVLSYLLGVFTKENVAILPLFIVLYEFYFFQNLDLSPRGKKVVYWLVGTLLILGAFGLILWGQRYYYDIVEGYKMRDFTLEERVLTQFRVVLYYVTLLIYPHPLRLTLDYDFSISKTILDPPTTLISILIIAGLMGYSIWIAKRKPVLSYFILWYFGNLVIESSIFPLEMVFEHRLYLPAVGPFILFSLLIVRGIEKLRAREAISHIETAKPHLIQILVFLVIILLLSIGTYSRNEIWNDEIGLWKDCLKKSPKKARPYVNLGFAYLDAGIYDQAMEATQNALKIDPKYAHAYYNLSIIYQKMGDLSQAVKMGKKALEIDPDLHMAYYSLGGIYFEKGQYEESIEAYKKFLSVFPYFPNVHHLLAIVYASRKQFDQAIIEFEYEIRINPYHALAHLNVGQIYWYEFHKKQKALDHLKMALFLDPLLPNRGEIRKLVHTLEGFP
jgi:Tfp pilus assembly protein PilF